MKEIWQYNSTITISHSNIEGGWAGTGNIDADPQFVGNGDYHLTPTSPCIENGTDDTALYPLLPVDDMDGEEWNSAAVGPMKRRLSGELLLRLPDRTVR